MKPGLTRKDAGRLLVCLKAHAEEVARELREAGWEEDDRGLWSLPGSEGWTNQFQGLHLFDAHALARGREA